MSPSISVIMPAYNAERTIELALRSIRMQTIATKSKFWSLTAAAPMLPVRLPGSMVL